MPIKRKERENSNETTTTCVKPYRMDHIPTEHELFLQAFESKSFINNNHICTLTHPAPNFSWIYTIHNWLIRYNIIIEPTQIYRYLRSRNRLSVSSMLHSWPFFFCFQFDSWMYRNDKIQPIWLHVTADIFTPKSNVHERSHVTQA